MQATSLPYCARSNICFTSTVEFPSDAAAAEQVEALSYTRMRLQGSPDWQSPPVDDDLMGQPYH